MLTAFIFLLTLTAYTVVLGKSTSKTLDTLPQFKKAALMCVCTLTLCGLSACQSKKAETETGDEQECDTIVCEEAQADTNGYAEPVDTTPQIVEDTPSQEVSEATSPETEPEEVAAPAKQESKGLVGKWRVTFTVKAAGSCVIAIYKRGGEYYYSQSFGSTEDEQVHLTKRGVKLYKDDGEFGEYFVLGGGGLEFYDNDGLMSDGSVCTISRIQ